MSAFHPTDIYGIIGAMLLLVFVYLLLNNWMATNALVNTTFSGSNSLLKTLQGR